MSQCAGVTLPQFLSKVSDNTTSLCVVYFIISEIRTYTFLNERLFKVMYLEIENCGITRVEGGTFSGLADLKNLSLVKITLKKKSISEYVQWCQES